MSAYVIIDILVLAVILLFVLRGAAKGLILSLAGLAALIVAFAGANYVSNRFSGDMVSVVKPFVSNFVQGKADDVIKKNPGYSKDSNGITKVVSETLIDLGLAENAAEHLTTRVTDKMKSTKDTIKIALTDAFSQTVSRILLFCISFFIIIVLFAIIANIANFAFKLPGLRFINALGGGIFGLVSGLAIVWAAAYVFRYLGNILPEGTAENTVLMKFFMTNNPFTIIFGQ